MSRYTEEHETMIADCEARESRLSDYDRTFIESMRDWVDGGRSLTDKQAAVLERIWERATARG